MRRILPLAIGVIALIIVTVIAINNSRGTTAPGPIKITETVKPTTAVQVEVLATATPVKVDVGNVGSPRVFAWNPNTAQLTWFGKDAKMSAVGQPDLSKSNFSICGVTPNGDNLIVLQGTDMLLLPLNGGAPVTLGQNITLACDLPGRTQISPDGNRLATIKYTVDAISQSYASGVLRVVKIPDATQQTTLDNVVSFDLQNDGVVAVQFFNNTKGQAKTADIIFWDGNKIRKIEESLGVQNKDDKADCEFVAGKALRVAERVYILFGEKCKQIGNTWRIRRVDFSGANGQDLVSGKTGANGSAAYFTNAATNEMYVFPNGNDILFTVPNGVSSDLVNVERLSTADSTVKDVLQSVASDEFMRSPDGKFYLFVTRNGDKTEQLYLYDLTQPDKSPAAVTGGGKLDRITGAAWQKDSQRLFYNITGDTQALYSYNLKGESNLIARGTFTGLGINQDGSQAATSEHKADPGNAHENLVLISTGDESKVVLVEGAKGEKPLLPILVR